MDTWITCSSPGLASSSMSFYTSRREPDKHLRGRIGMPRKEDYIALPEEKFMTDQVIGYLLLALSLVLYVVCGATFVAMLQALMVSSTISAIESAFGTFVIGILLLVLGKKSYQAGKKRLKTAN